MFSFSRRYVEWYTRLAINYNRAFIIFCSHKILYCNLSSFTRWCSIRIQFLDEYQELFQFIDGLEYQKCRSLVELAIETQVRIFKGNFCAWLMKFWIRMNLLVASATEKELFYCITGTVSHMVVMSFVYFNPFFANIQYCKS